MWPSETLIMLLGCLCVLLAAVSPSVHADTTVYGILGGEAVLRPPDSSVKDSITEIAWKVGPNKAMEWGTGDKNVTVFSQFLGRGHLDTSTGVMTIRGLLYNDSNSYTPEINSNRLAPVHLTVLSPVPVPTVSTSCNESQCELTCEGDTTRAIPVNYTWMVDDTVIDGSLGKQYTVLKSQENSLSSKEFSCKIQNPISRERSEPIIISSDSFTFIPPSEGGPNISLGVTVLIVLLAAVILLVAFHKCKTGMWFFEKESMPWEGAFWRREGRQRDTPAANGATAQQQNDKTEEEIPMTNG